MKEEGIGGFEVQPVYPLALDDAAAGIKNFHYLSDAFIDVLHFTSEKARENCRGAPCDRPSEWLANGVVEVPTESGWRIRCRHVCVCDEENSQLCRRHRRR